MCQNTASELLGSLCGSAPVFLISGTRHAPFLPMTGCRVIFDIALLKRREVNANREQT